MSQTMNAATVPVGTSVQPSATRWWAAIIGVAVAGLLGYGAAMVVTGHVPWVEHSATTVEAVGVAEVQPTPAVANAAGDDALTGSRATTQSASDEALQRVTAGSVSAGSANVGTVDPFEAQLVSPQLQAAVGAAGGEGLISRRLATQSASDEALRRATAGSVNHGTVDPFETRSEISGTDTSTDGRPEAQGPSGGRVSPEFR